LECDIFVTNVAQKIEKYKHLNVNDELIRHKAGSIAIVTAHYKLSVNYYYCHMIIITILDIVEYVANDYVNISSGSSSNWFHVPVFIISWQGYFFI